MRGKYNLSLVFYPQPDGEYHVACPEIPNCYTCGGTMDEARTNIYALIRDLLPDAAVSVDPEMFREGLCMRGKSFEEVEFQINESGEVAFPSEVLLHAVGAEE